MEPEPKEAKAEYSTGRRHYVEGVYIIHTCPPFRKGVKNLDTADPEGKEE